MKLARWPENTFDITMRPKDKLQLELEEAFDKYKIDSDQYFQVLNGKQNYSFRVVNYELSYCIIEKEPSEATLHLFKNRHMRLFYMSKITDLNHIIDDIISHRQTQRQWNAQRDIAHKPYKRV